MLGQTSRSNLNSRSPSWTNLPSTPSPTRFAEIDLHFSDEQLHPIVSARVAELLGEQIERHSRPITLTLGCHLIEGDEPYPLQIGPVLFERVRVGGNACWPLAS